MQRNTKIFYFFLITAFTVVHPFLPAGGTIQEAMDSALNAYKDDIEYDSGLIMGWYCDQFSRVVAFSGSSELNSPAEILEPGKFELGLGGTGSISKIDTDAFKRLQTVLIVTTQTAPSGDLGFFDLIFNMRFNLSKKYDMEIKSGGISVEPAGANNIAIKNTVLGAEVRMQMMKRPSSFMDLVGAIALNKVDGFIEIASTGNTSTSNFIFSGDGINYSQTDETYNSFRTNWNFFSFSLRAMASTQISFLRPILGLQLDVNTGEIKGTLSTRGTKTLVEAGNPSNTLQGNIDMTGTGGSAIPQVNVRTIAGFEFNFSSIMLGYTLENAGDNSSSMVNLRFKF